MNIFIVNVLIELCPWLMFKQIIKITNRIELFSLKRITAIIKFDIDNF